jgi:hypothetical protein
LALVIGNLVAQVFFRQEIETFLFNSVAPQNAAIVVQHRREVQEQLAAGLKVKQRDAADTEKLKGQADALRKQQVLNTRRAASPTRYQQPGAEAGRQLTTTTLAGYEAKAAAAETQALASAKAYDDLLKDSGIKLKALTQADPSYVAPPTGLLSATHALGEIGKQDRSVLWGERLIE